ncbi:MAG: ATP-dependent DNA helicase RecG, partial [Gammaproteobacteria bacterium]|nr:ATP-dependent DNA helicase RecG [Gammaproteobacteria bacterium]
TNALAQLENEATSHELIPADFLTAFGLPSFKEALMFVHKPPRETNVSQLLANETTAQKRLVFEELLAHRISLLQLKQRFQSQASVVLSQQESIIHLFRQQLAFSLTRAQERVIQEIQLDLVKPYPMLRLVQGDVGSGKTVVAAFAILQAVANGYQAAIMAPTELLAEQHARVLTQWFSGLGFAVVLLSGNIKAQARVAALKAIASNEAQVIVGTHALFQEAVHFSKLALVIVDEQHRFGVQQRALLREKGQQADYYPHQLIMTATPIPRTLAMSFYADLDCSTIDELPPGRTPIVTSVMAASRRAEVIARIRSACKQGRQVYWVCPLIEESELISSQAATQTAEQLLTLFKGEINIGLIHGRMHARDKEKIMRDFQMGQIHLLVATTVIEVGVDVANASVMIIENAERLGLSQLHQLRGRVGRGLAASHCVLLYQSPLSPLAKERLAVMRSTTDGFVIAQRDLLLRGPGEVLGTKQTGEVLFRVADLVRDSHILSDVHKVADKVLQTHPQFITPLIQRWIGDAEEYGKV